MSAFVCACVSVHVLYLSPPILKLLIPVLWVKEKKMWYHSTLLKQKQEKKLYLDLHATLYHSQTGAQQMLHTSMY